MYRKMYLWGGIQVMSSVQMKQNNQTRETQN